MALLRVLGLLLLVCAVALVVFDAALYLKGGPFALTTFDKMWALAGGAYLFDLRRTLSSGLGTTGDWVADLPAVIVVAVLAVLFLAISRRTARSVE